MRSERALVVAAALLLAADVGVAHAASLVGVRERGTFDVCAHPDALPYSSRDRSTPGFQLEIAEAIAKQLGVGLHVDWIVFTRHARRIDCDASIGSIVRADTDGGGPRRGPRLTKPYVTSGYVLVVPPTSPPIERLEDVKGKIAVEHTSWPHYVLERRNLPLSSHGSPFDVLDAVAQGQSAAGLVSDAYTGWYLKLHPGAVKISETYVPERDFRWNVAVGLRNADTPLVEAVNHALDTLIADQTIPKIFARYGITYRPPATP
jgi:polar amino acid transport system substrate-binding protein